jgi:RNAse (barnase) inhibitor barstar
MTMRDIDRLEDLPSQCIRSLRGLGTEQLRAWARAADQRFVLADLSGCKDRPSAMRMLGHAFSLPSWFGANLDALYDALTDDEVAPAGNGTVVVLDSLPYTEHFGVEERDALLDVFRDVAEHHARRGTPFRVFYR